MPEDKLITTRREQRSQQQQQQQSLGQNESSSGLAGGGKESQEDVMGDKNRYTDTEQTSADSGSENVFREAMKREKNRKKKRQRSQDGDGDGGGNDTDSVPGQIPKDLLTKISPLCEKLGLSMRQQLSMAMGFAELCGKYTK